MKKKKKVVPAVQPIIDHSETLMVADLEKKLKTNLKTGLKNEVATKRLAQDGKNQLPQGKVRPWFVTFLLALFEPLQIVLLLAAVIAIVAPLIASGQPDFIDFAVIILIVFLDAILETVQSVKARKSVDALKSLSRPVAIVIRDGKQFEIDAVDLVVGDLVVIEAGKYIPAELRLVETSEFSIDEAILTGESMVVDKQSKPIKPTTILAEKTNIAFMSTFATSGRALGIVIATGSHTEVGKIATTINDNATFKTPLEKKLTSFSYWISLIALGLGVLIFVALYFVADRSQWTSFLMIAITLAIGVIPESLGAVVSITLSVSTKRMAKENVIVKRLSSVETLGSVNVICTDKTGTLTQNKMTVRRVLFNGQAYTNHEFVKLNLDSFSETIFNQALVLPNDAITDGKERIGDPTELALIDFAEDLGVDELKFRQKYQRLDEIPFDSKRKLMTTLNQISNEVKVNFTKGALDELLKKCRKILIDGQAVVLTDAIKAVIMKQAAMMSNDALRVLGFAYKEVRSVKVSEKDLVFLGAVGMIDPVRETAIDAVHHAHDANIRVVMITGDHPRTALAIAKELDIAYTEYEVMTSAVLEEMDDEQLSRVIDNIRVFARVNPEHKTRIVQALQKKRNVTAMTGDGVNDAPSLSIADIGISMGITGTDVAKEASDVILTDDNFGTIMKGVNEGRNVYQKIKRTIVFLLGVNLANVLSILILALVNQSLPLAATDILWINLIVESVLAISLGMGPLDDNLMKLQPIKGSNNLLKGLGYSIIKIMVSLTLMEIASFYVGIWITTGAWTVNDETIVYGQTALFICATLSPTIVAHVIKLTNWKISKKIDLKVNKALLIASLGSILLNLVVIFTPGLNTVVFHLLPLESWTGNAWYMLLTSIGFALGTPLIIVIGDGIVFFSYHYAQSSWTRNQTLVNKYVAADIKREKNKLKKQKPN